MAIGATIAARLVEGSTTRLTEIAHRGVLGLDQLATVETACSEGQAFRADVSLDAWFQASEQCLLKNIGLKHLWDPGIALGPIAGFHDMMCRGCNLL